MCVVGGGELHRDDFCPQIYNTQKDKLNKTCKSSEGAQGVCAWGRALSLKSLPPGRGPTCWQVWHPNSGDERHLN